MVICCDKLEIDEVIAKSLEKKKFKEFTDTGVHVLYSVA